MLLLEDTKSKLLFKDDINDVLLMEATKYSARKKQVCNSESSGLTQYAGVGW